MDENKVNGNTAGIRATQLEEIKRLYEFELGQDTFASAELLTHLAACTAAINREILVYIRRNGAIADVSVGDANTVSMPELRVVRNTDRLAGVRCVHTHPSGSGRLSDVDIGSLRSLKLDCMAALSVREGQPGSFYAAYLGEWKDDGYEVLEYGPLNPFRLPQRELMREIYEADGRLKSTAFETAAARPERAVLVGIEENGALDSMKELAELARTAGAQVVETSVQRRRSVDNATYIGSGKVDELRLTGSAVEADLFIFDDELSGVQLRNLEEGLGRPVIDRTTLILDIFASRAQSREGRLQVELAQQKYRLPRLAGAGLALSRLGGGIGTRGPGEKKLELDRRRIRRRIYELEQELNELVKQRALRRERREKNAMPLVALVGYTNAGKSTLLNVLSGSDVLAENKLFATLDPVVRQVELPGNTQCLFSDTVGFIHKLPHELVEAFRATLEEVKTADLLLHVVDCANPEYDAQMAVVEEVLASLGAADTPRINVYNQIDREGALPGHRGEWAHISAREGTGVTELLVMVEKTLTSSQTRVELLVPYDRYEAMALIRNLARILSEEHTGEGTLVTVMADQAVLGRIKAALS